MKKILLALASAILFFSPSHSIGAEAIQTQEAELYDGVAADVTDITVKNNIVTAKFKLRNTGTVKHSVKIFYDSCYLVDENNQKKYYALKDSDGIFVAGPQADEDRGGRFWFEIQPNQAKNMWIKFPQPADNPETVTIAIAGFLPFEEIPLTK